MSIAEQPFQVHVALAAKLVDLQGLTVRRADQRRVPRAGDGLDMLYPRRG
jgi:hypothetical protein